MINVYVYIVYAIHWKHCDFSSFEPIGSKVSYSCTYTYMYTVYDVKFLVLLFTYLKAYPIGSVMSGSISVLFYMYMNKYLIVNILPYSFFFSWMFILLYSELSIPYLIARFIYGSFAVSSIPVSRNSQFIIYFWVTDWLVINGMNFLYINIVGLHWLGNSKFQRHI